MSTKDKKYCQQLYLAPIISQTKIGSSGYFKLVLHAKNIAQKSSPGQFITIRCGDRVFFRRPFSIADILDDKIELIFKVVGIGTEWLSERKSGDKLDILGPLGNGFDLTVDLHSSRALLVAGGSGIASLAYLAKRINPGIFFYGTKTKGEIVRINSFENWEIKFSTEDGSSGHRGLITDLVDKFLSDCDTKFLKPRIYACGPKKMLKQIAVFSKKYNLPCQVSLEEIMACGVGACRGCVIQTKDGYKSVCKDGPVFNAGDCYYFLNY